MDSVAVAAQGNQNLIPHDQKQFCIETRDLRLTHGQFMVDVGSISGHIDDFLGVTIEVANNPATPLHDTPCVRVHFSDSSVALNIYKLGIDRLYLSLENGVSMTPTTSQGKNGFWIADQAGSASSLPRFDIPTAVRNQADDDAITCPFCKTSTHISSLAGERSNNCPSCGQPALVLSFRDIAIGTVFLCAAGMKWVKVDSEIAVLTTEYDLDHCQGYTGQKSEFSPHDLCAAF